MIKANNLRVGNFIYCGGKVVEVTYHHIRLATIQYTVKGEAPNYEPIPLKPELLEKCGFKLKEDKYFEKGLFVIYEFSEGIYTIYNYTGEELEIDCSQFAN